MTRFKRAFLIFILINFSVYFYISKFHHLVPFNYYLYLNSAYHYMDDERLSSGKFNLIRAIGVFDSQWYLKIADRGYPKNPDTEETNYKLDMERLTYAFFPLYPLSLAIINWGIGYLELSAFIFSIVITAACFYSIYFVVTKLYDENIAYKTSLLLFLFPFSIFFRSYYTEGLFLLILTWYSYFLIKKKWLYASVLQGLLAVTRPTGLFLIPLTLIFVLRDFLSKKIPFVKLIIYFSFIFGFLAIWMAYNYYMTGDLLFWKNVQSAWFSKNSFAEVIRHNYFLLKSFFSLPFHDIHLSKVDLFTFYMFGWLVVLSVSFLKKELWWISFLMWIIPIFLKDTTSISRYQAVSFPLFIYLASKLSRKSFAFVSALFYSVTLFVSLYFINWYWIG